MVRKKNPASDLKMKIYKESLSREKYILEKIHILEKKQNKIPTLSYQLKKIKRHAIG